MFLGNDAGVVFDIGGRGDLIGEFDQIVGTANSLQVAGLFQLLRHGEQVDRLRTLEQPQHGLEDVLMPFEIKTIRPQNVEHYGQRILVEHQGAQHGFLQFARLRLHLAEHEVRQFAAGARLKLLRLIISTLFCHIRNAGRPAG